MELSERLEAVLALLPDCRVLADIGTDHAFVPIEAVERGKADRALACDVVPGPLERAAEHIGRRGLEDRIECRMGDGLEPLKEDEADCVVIAGMGGRLMLRLLSDRRDLTESVPCLILSPHTDAPEVRRSLKSFGRKISAEVMVEEEGKFYVIMRTVPGERDLSEEERLFGPVLLRERPEVFLRWLENEARKTEELIGKLSEKRSDRTAQALAEKKRYLVLVLRALEYKLDTQEGFS